ncbi:right-handed parallel beta-helix repeat-containing protein, partial [Corynebacterium diphtheriae]|uniref:right-handed parallel beta-helix repeat-containing protein n=1 Tax=Corynebacterium diphtheriae TaxID=1717 RepID=UPI0011611E69
MRAKENVIVTVGENGDFTRLSAAIEYLSNKLALFVNDGVKAEINLLSGYVLDEQILIRGLDLGFITITSEDEQVTIARSALTTPFLVNDLDNEFPAIGGGENAVLPVIDVLFYMNEWGVGTNRHGIFVADNSSVFVKPNKGCINAGGSGLYAINGARATAYEGIFDDAKNAGVRCFRGSWMSVRRASIRNAGQSGAYLGSSSVVEALGADFSGAGQYGAWVYAGGRLNCRDGDLSNAGN